MGRPSQQLVAGIPPLVREDPGITTIEVVRRLGCQRGTARYHLARLQATGVLASFRIRNRDHYFPPELPPLTRHRLAVLRTGETVALARAVQEHPGQRQRDLTERLGLSRKTFRKYVDGLIETGLVTESRSSTVLIYAATAELAETLATLNGRLAAPGKPPRGAGHL